jgi:sec-independent protein translocase protein TatA
MPGIGVPEVLVILIIGLVVLGPKRLPEAGRSLGKGLRGFKAELAGSADHHQAAPQQPVKGDDA